LPFLVTFSLFVNDLFVFVDIKIIYQVIKQKIIKKIVVVRLRPLNNDTQTLRTLLGRI
jgi:hypothetical protein